MALITCLTSFFVCSQQAQNIKEVSFTEFASNLQQLQSISSNSEEDATSPYKLKRIIVKSKQYVDGHGAIDVVSGYNDLYIFQYASIEDTMRAHEYFKTLDYIEWCVVDQEVSACGLEDSFSYQSWGVSDMGVEEYSTYLTTQIGTSNLNEVVVAVLDTGIDTDHSWFTNRILYSYGKDFSGDSHSTAYEFEDEDGHGTHVAGIICDLTLANVKILPVKVLGNNGLGSLTGIIAGMNYVIDLKKNGLNICAINLSLAAINTPIGSANYNLCKDAIDAAYDEGILCVVAGGNEGVDVENVIPSNVEKAITVSVVEFPLNTTDINELRVCNYGSKIDFCAPGSDILSAHINGGTILRSGTSMAAPHVCACIALLYSDSNKNYTMSQVENKLRENAIDIGTSGWDPSFGYGFVNIKYAYADAISAPTFSSDVKEHDGAFMLTLTSDIPAVIVYTTDGTDPTEDNGTVYDGAIYVSSTVRIKARCYVNGTYILKCSPISEMVYIIGGKDVENCFVVEGNKIKKYNGLFTDVVVPQSVNNVEINIIGKDAFACSKVQSVTLPETVTDVQGEAFMFCYDLTTVQMPGVTIVGYLAFYDCQSLCNITLEQVTSLGSGENFIWCASLQSVNMPLLSTIPSESFMMCYNLQSASFATATSIGEHGFMGCGKLSTINIPNVQIIESYVFKYCYALEKVYLPSLAGFIYDDVFDNNGVINIVLGNNFTFNMFSSSIPTDIVIYGYAGSFAQAYANSNGNEFVIIDAFNINQNLNTSELVLLNNMLSLNFNVSGYDITYKWYRTASGEVEDGVEIVGVTTNTYVCPTGQVGTNYYYCIATNWDSQKYISNVCECVVWTNTVTYTIEVSCNLGGTVSPSGMVVNQGEDATFTFTADLGYYLQGIYIDDEYAGNDLTYTFTNVQADHILQAVFARNLFYISIIKVGSGTVYPNETSVQVGLDQNITISFSHEQNWGVEDVLIDGVSVGALTSYTFTSVNADHTLQVTFVDITEYYSITLKPNSFVYLECNESLTKIVSGQSRIVHLLVQNGYKIAKFTVNGEDYNLNGNFITFNDIQCDLVLEATTELITSKGEQNEIEKEQENGATSLTKEEQVLQVIKYSFMGGGAIFVILLVIYIINGIRKRRK